MAACFQLTKKGETEPAILQRIDDELWRLIGKEPDPEHWCLGWYNTVGLLLACGKDWDQIRKIHEEELKRMPNCRMIIDYLEDNYEVNAFHQGR